MADLPLSPALPPFPVAAPAPIPSTRPAEAEPKPTEPVVPTPNLTPPPLPFTAPAIPQQDHSQPISRPAAWAWALTVYRRVQQAQAEYRRTPGLDSLTALRAYLEGEIVAITGRDMMHRAFDPLGKRPDLIPFVHPLPDAPDPATPSHHSRGEAGEVRTHEHKEVAIVRGVLFGWHKVLQDAAQPGADLAGKMREFEGRVNHQVMLQESRKEGG